MLPLRLLLIVPLVLASPSLAQGTKQGTVNRAQHVTTGSRTPVATQPSNNPFRNPIGQGVPPAASANPNLNSNRTNVPADGVSHVAHLSCRHRPDRLALEPRCPPHRRTAPGLSREPRPAKAEFKAAWEALKARTPPEQLAAAYKAMNIRDDD
jgi:hypothetical protein